MQSLARAHSAVFRTWPLSKSFALLSGPLLFAAGLLLATMNHVWYVEGIERAAERNNVALTRIFSNVIWPEFEDHIVNAVSSGGSQGWRDALRAKIAAIAGDTSIAKIKLYRLDGVTAFSTDPAELEELEEDNDGFQAASQGRVASEFELEDKINTFDKVINDRNTVSSYVPIFSTGDPTKIVAVFEVYDDITELLAQFHHAEIRTSVFVGSVFLLIYAALVAVVMRSERNARRHYEDGLRLADAAAKADAASTAKSAFLANMSHELRTPLNAIVGFSEMMKKELLGPVTPKSYADYANHIWQAASHLTDVIGAILDLSKIDAGKATVDRAPVILSETVSVVREMVGERAEKRGVSLTCEVEADLGTLDTDGVKLRQILLNLLTNAIKFTSRGGRVVLRATRAGGEIAFSIRDTGIGMTPAELEIAMSPFGQVQSPFARDHQGTGLGLPLTQRLVTLLGGRLELLSEKNRGTIVTMVLPADAREAATAQDAGIENTGSERNSRTM